MAVQRWRFTDPHNNNEQWTVPLNPESMTSPFPEKNVSLRYTTAVDGRVLMFEGQAAPKQWQFAGQILSADHYAQLLYWTVKRNRVRIRDHFGRTLNVYLLSFDPEPQRSARIVGGPPDADAYWRHSYTVNGLVLSVSPPTVAV